MAVVMFLGADVGTSVGIAVMLVRTGDGAAVGMAVLLVAVDAYEPSPYETYEP